MRGIIIWLFLLSSPLAWGDVKEKPSRTSEFSVFLGNYTQKTDSFFSGGIKYNTKLDTRLGYEVQLEVNEKYKVFNHSLQFFAKPEPNTSYLFFSNGFEFFQDQSNKLFKTNGYTAVGLGYIIKVQDKIVLDIRAGNNVTSRFSPHMKIVGYKPLPNGSRLGIYVDYMSTSSPFETRKEDSRYFSGGLIFSY